MPARSTIETLPPELREKLDSTLVQRNFSGYRDLVDAFNEQLAASGLELRISRSGLHRYGQDLEQRIAGLRRTTEIARTIAQEAGDDEGAMSDALIRLVQDKLFTLTLDMEIDPSEVDVYKLGRVVAELGKATVAQKKHQVTMKAKAAAVATAVAEKVKEGGLSAEAIETIRRDILGIVNE